MSENNRMTNVPEFLSGLDAGVFENRYSKPIPVNSKLNYFMPLKPTVFLLPAPENKLV
ncbi:hypothetical protein Q4R68_16900 [Morganella morganii]